MIASPLLDIYAGFNLIHTEGFKTPENNVSLKEKSKIDKNIDIAARKFFEALQAKQPPSPGLQELIAFRAAQAAFATVHEYNLGEGDHNYYKNKGWFERDSRYFTDAKINPVKNVIAILVGKIVRRNVLKDLQGVPWNS